jgi:hypothetical protein
MFERALQRLGRAPDRYPVEPSAGAGRDARHSVLASWWVTAVGVVLAVAGAAGALWGLVLLRGALSADNAGNPLREVGVAMGVGASLLGALPCLGGIALVWASGRRRRSR